jgi:hypothetical protein
LAEAVQRWADLFTSLSFFLCPEKTKFEINLLKTMKRLCILLLFLSGACAFASTPALPDTAQENRFLVLDEYAKKVPKEHEKDVKSLAGYLIIPTRSELEKARVIYTWLATHIKYDDAAYNRGKPGDQSTNTVLKNRRSVCEGYSNLGKDLFEYAGLQAEKVVGYSKGYSYKKGKKFKDSDHAWNAVKADGKWRLMDATWGSGYGMKVDGKLKTKPRFDPYWFDVDPKEFIFTHLPEDQQWQLLDSTVALREFEKMPVAGDSFFKLGFNSNQVFQDVKDGRVKELTTVYDIPVPVKAVQLPYTENISKKESMDFVLESDAQGMVLIDGKSWHSFEKNGTTFTLSHQPKHKKVMIALVKSKNSKDCSVVLRYKVKK